MSDIPPSIPVNQQMVRLIQQQIAASLAEQIESDDDLSQYFELAAFNPMTFAQRFRNLSQMRHLTREMDETETVQEMKILAPEEVDEAAARFQRNNFELNARTLRILRSRILPGDTPEEVLAKVLAVYPDPSLADEALDFLLETAQAQTAGTIREAKALLNARKGDGNRCGAQYGRSCTGIFRKGTGLAEEFERSVSGHRVESARSAGPFHRADRQIPLRKVETGAHFYAPLFGKRSQIEGAVDRAGRAEAAVR